MVTFYRDVLGPIVADDMHNYVEFESAGVRFSICHRDIMYDATGHGASPGRRAASVWAGLSVPTGGSTV